MKKNAKTYFILAGLLFFLFVLFTVFVTRFDVKPIGPEQSMVGFATINQFVFDLIGVHSIWYDITDWLGVFAILVALGFAAVGLYQLLKRKSLRKVDREISILGTFYVLVIGFYLFFEQVVINYRPVILDNVLEPSYPSSHTILVVCIMATAALQLHSFFPNKKKFCFGMDLVAAFLVTLTVIGRLMAGVHWFTDLVGGLLLSAALVALYCAVIEYIDPRSKDDVPFVV